VGLAASQQDFVNSCMKTSQSNIKTVDQQLESFGVKPNDPCPEQDLYDSAEKKCSENVKELRGIDKQLRKVMSDKCANGYKIQQAAASTGSKQTDTQNKSSAIYKEGANLNRKEIEILGQLREQVKEMRKFYADIADGAKQIQEKVDGNSKSDPNGKDEHTDKLKKAGSRRGVNANNNEQAVKFFKDSIGTVSGVVQKASQGGITKADVDQIKTPLTQEPLRIAAAADDWDKQIAARQKVVENQNMLYDENHYKTDDSAKKLGDAEGDKTGGKNSGSGGGDSAGNAASSMGDASKALQAASGLAGAGQGGSSGSESPSSAAASTTPDLSGLASGLNGSSGSSGGGTTGSYSPSEYGNTSTNYGNSAGSTANSNGTTAVGANPTAGGTSLLGKNGTNGIQNLDTTSTATGTTSNDRSGSSATKGSSLREALRERLSQSMAESSGGGGGSTSATNAGAAGGGTGSNASSGAVTPDLLPMSMPIASDNVLEASSASVGGDLGNTDFSLAGSETDAAVKGMLKDFGVGGADDHSARGPASEAKSAPEILASDSPSLFMRTREVHQRSLKKGLVINGLRAKL